MTEHPSREQVLQLKLDFCELGVSFRDINIDHVDGTLYIDHCLMLIKSIRFTIRIGFWGIGRIVALMNL
jgi:hypothetical protein